MNKVLAALACGLLALPAVAAGPGTLTVDDRAGAFTADGIAKAKGLMEAAEFGSPAHLVVVTGSTKDIPPAYKAGFDKAREAKDVKAGQRVLGDWAADEALKQPHKGVFVLIWTDGSGVMVHPKSDRSTDHRGFVEADDKKLADLLVKEFKSNEKDKGLYEATAFVVDRLKHTSAPTSPAATGGGRHAVPAKANNGGYNVGSLICFGLLAVLAIWLVFGLIRAFTAPRGGYGPGGGYGGPGGGYGGGGYGGGGGGGGFMSGMMGGLFGAVAGNYLYNSFAGGGSHLGASGTDGGSYGGAGGLPDATAGDGDYAGGSEAGAGDFGDAGGGYGDAGGGGDFGGDDAGGGYGDAGGGDYGGGGGDFGGGDSGGGGGDW